jgi:protocatechuate 3,4-dioxygenase beta subunit
MMSERSGWPRPVWRRGGTGKADAMLGRREAIAAVAACWAGAWMPRAAAQPPGSCVLTPDSGEGPFYFDPDLVRTDVREGSAGATLDLEIRIIRAGDCATLRDARVDLWHADALGLYSGYAQQPGVGAAAASVEGKTFLRGTQATDPDGRVRFRTIYPSWYRGRTPHLHFKVFLDNEEVVTSQVFFPEEFNRQVFSTHAPYSEHVERRDTFNENDSFLRGTPTGVFCAVEDTDDGYRGTLTVAVRRA